MPCEVSYEYKQKRRAAKAVDIYAKCNEERQSSGKVEDGFLQGGKKRKGCAKAMKVCEVFMLPVSVALILRQSILVSFQHRS